MNIGELKRECLKWLRWNRPELVELADGAEWRFEGDGVVLASLSLPGDLSLAMGVSEALRDLVEGVDGETKEKT